MCNTIENKCLSDEFVSSLEQKIKKLEEEVLDMREWSKLLLPANPTLETNMDMSHFLSQSTLQNNTPAPHPPPRYPTSQNQPSFVQMPPKNTHLENHPYPPQHHVYASRPQYLTPCLQNPTMQAPRYETPLHQVPWPQCAFHTTFNPSISNVSVPKASSTIIINISWTQYKSHHSTAYSRKYLQG